METMMSKPVLLAAFATPDPNETAAMEDYLAKGPPLLIEAGGTLRFRARKLDQITGEAGPAMMFLAEYESADAVRAAFDSEAYKATLPARDKAFKTMDILIMEEV